MRQPKYTLTGFFNLVWVFVFACHPAMVNAESIATGSLTGTYYAIGNNLKNMVNPLLEVKNTGGSWANVEALSRTPGVSLAIVQADVYDEFVRLRDDKGEKDDTRQEYNQLLAHLRVFMPLYYEEVHFLVRKDDPMEFIHQIKGKRIWMDVEKSGTFFTTMSLYNRMFHEMPKPVKPFMSGNSNEKNSALMALSNPDAFSDAQKIDVMVLVGGQPYALLTEKDIPANLKLLKFDSSQMGALNILSDYRRVEIQKSNYPQLKNSEDKLPALAVDAYLITADFADPDRNQYIKNFAQQFCAKFSDLQEKGHPKWRALTWRPGSPLPSLAKGWRYSDKAKEYLVGCRPSVPATESSPKINKRRK